MLKQTLLALGCLSLISEAFAASDNIRKDRDYECGLYICVPGGFPSSTCATAHELMVERITDVTHKGKRKWTTLPGFSHCDDGSGEALLRSYGLPYKQSNVNYFERIDAHIPEHNECTHFSPIRVCDRSNGDYSCHTEYYCDAWKTVPEHYVEGTECKFARDRASVWSDASKYRYDAKGQIIGTYDSPQWCDRNVHTMAVTVDGQIVGNEWREGVNPVGSVDDDDNYVEVSTNEMITSAVESQTD